MAIGIGIELNPSAVRALVLESVSSTKARPATKPVKLLAFQELPCDTANPEALTRVLAQLRHAVRIRQPVILGVPSLSTLLTTVSPLVPNPKRASLAVAFELQQYLPFALEEAVWHYRWLSPNGQGATSVQDRRTFGVRNSEFGIGAPRSGEAVVAAMKRSLLDQRLACCRHAGLVVQAVSVNPVAALSVWSVVQHAARSSDATRAVASSTVILHMLTEQMAEWIVWHPTALHVMPVERPTPETLGQELATSWEALRVQGPELPQPVWVIGVTPATATVQTFARTAGVRVEPVNVAALLPTGSAALQVSERGVVTLGLALQAVGLAPLGINFLEGMLSEARARRVERTCLMASGCCAVALVFLGVRGMVAVHRRQAQLFQRLEAQERLYQSLRPEVRSLLQQQHRLEQRSLQLDRLAQSSPAIIQALSGVATALPESVWLTKFECTKSDTLLEGQLEGHAKSFQDVTRFLGSLKSEAGMTSVKLLSNTVTTDQENGKELIAFSVQVQRPLRPTE